MLLMIDNYDSFTYNLVQCFTALGQEVKVFYSDQISLETIDNINPEFICLSPGPKGPADAGICLPLVKRFTENPAKNFIKKRAIFGVCLGHQVIGAAFGYTVTNAKTIMHGKLDKIRNNGLGLFTGLPGQFSAMRYNSLAVVSNKLFHSNDLLITAINGEGEIMGLQHKFLPIYGVQFHPESILSQYGLELCSNFLLCHNKSVLN